MFCENTELNKKWLYYNQIRLMGDKKLANNLLNIFIESILKYDKCIIEDFVYEICSFVLKDDIISNNGEDVSNAQFRIQHPLLKKVIIPVLIKKYKENNPLYIRWIAQFEQFFYSDKKMTNYFLKEINDINLPENYFITRDFLKKSFKLEANQITLKLLLKRLAQDIYYYIHELPLLISPDNFIVDVDEFKYYYKKYNNKNEWKNELEKWIEISNYL